MDADITNDRALGGNLRLQPSSLFQALGKASPGENLGLHCSGHSPSPLHERISPPSRCQAERTNESAPTTGALPNCIQSDLQAASLVGWTSRTGARDRNRPGLHCLWDPAHE